MKVYTCYIFFVYYMFYHFPVHPFLTTFLLFSCYVVSGSLQPHGLSPTRSFCPWDFPGKNTGVGCPFLLQGIFLTQESNTWLIHCQVNSLTTEPPGKHDHLPGFCQNFSLSTISFATFAFVWLPFAWNSSVHPFIFNHSMAFLGYLLCQSDTARGTPFFLSMRTLGNTSRPKENTSRHTVQLNMATVSVCGQWEVHRVLYGTLGGLLKRERARPRYCSSFFPFFSSGMRTGMAEALSSYLGPRSDLEDGSHVSGEGSRKTEEVRGGPSWLRAANQPGKRPGDPFNPRERGTSTVFKPWSVWFFCYMEISDL